MSNSNVVRAAARIAAFAFLALALVPASAWAQGHGSISGRVTDPSDAVVPDAEMTLTQLDTQVERTFVTGQDGFYSFPDVPPGDYRIEAAGIGFRTAQTEVSVRVTQLVRADLQLELGATTETVTVTATSSQINFEDATQQAGVGPNVLLKLPLLVGGGPRRATDFVLLIPGASTGGTDSAFSTRFNGGLQAGDEALMDGISMVEGTIGNNGMVSFADFAVTPEMVDEVRVLTSNYEPQYGTSNSAQIIAISRSGTNEYHGGVFLYHRNTVLNARQFGADTRPKDIENNYGGSIGGPVPGLNRGNMKTFFFYLNERFRIRGGVTRPTVSIPSLKQRQGDFTDWTDGQGKLIPVFDPLTTRTLPDGTIGRDQFACMGVPNVICPSRISNSPANQWFQHLPTPTNNQSLNNYLVPQVQSGGIDVDANLQQFKIDHHPGDADHFAVMLRWQRTPEFTRVTTLPRIITGDGDAEFFKRDLVRVNWDHIFSPTLVNTFNFGTLDWDFADFSLSGPEFVNDLPQIPGVEHNIPPAIRFSDGFEGFGAPFGTAEGNRFFTQNYIFNNLTTWVKGKHTIKFGGEYRWLRENFPLEANLNGTFNFGRASTGLLEINSGSPIASFLLERVENASAFVRSIERIKKQMDAYILHLGDSWRATPNLTVNYGIRWDLHRPTWNPDNVNSFFDPLGANPGAGGRLGRLAFAGTEHGEASFGARYPEHLNKTAFSPRLGLAYALNDRMVIRAGYGIFYSQPYYSGWEGGIAQHGLTSNPSFSSTQGGLEPAMILTEGFPQNFARPPFIDASFQNGQDILYRDFNGNRLTYSQQWNLTVERQLGADAHISVAYVANKGTRLPSAVASINAMDPRLLSMGNQLFDEFEPGQASLHGVPLPYNGWVEQMQGCAPSVAQALVPFPQYCSTLQAVNETAGSSIYHSFQLKLEKRFSEGTFLLASYTVSKLLTTSDHVQEPLLTGVFSPFERHRARSVSPTDVPQVLSVAFVYDLPFGPGKRFGNRGGALSKLIEGWSVSSIVRASSGLPASFRSSQCNVPGQLRAACIPALKEGANPFATGKDGFDPGAGRPLFDASAFEPLESFNFYTGAGPRVSNVRMFGFSNTNLAVYKTTKITEKVRFQVRAEFFNIWNQHIFTASGDFGSMAFTNDLASPDFGFWNGSVTNPRNIQIGTRLEF
jgi:hypothetical protein